MSNWFDRNKNRYPDDWSEIAQRTKAAAGWRCLACDAPHGPSPHILTVHHIDHEPSHGDASNLLACCQRCHLRIQGMRPRPKTKDEAIERLRARIAAEQSQLALEMEVPA